MANLLKLSTYKSPFEMPPSIWIVVPVIPPACSDDILQDLDTVTEENNKQPVIFFIGGSFHEWK